MARFAKIIAAAAPRRHGRCSRAAQYQQQYPQPYPQQGYPQQAYPQQAYPQQAIRSRATATTSSMGRTRTCVGAIIDSLIGNRYNVSDRQAIHRCADAAMQRAQGQNWGGNGRQTYPGYNNYLRVTAITDVQRRSSSVRVRGELGRGRYGNQPVRSAIRQRPALRRRGRGEVSFRCDVDFSGYVKNVRLEPLYRAY